MPAATMPTASDLLLDRNFIYNDDRLQAFLTTAPISHGHTIVRVLNAPQDGLFDLNPEDFQLILQTVRKLAELIRIQQSVSRCALVSDGGSNIHIVPLHGLDSEWNPILCTDKEVHDRYPGYVHSKDGPIMGDDTLNAVRDRIRSSSGLQDPINTSFLGDPEDRNLFANIVRGELKQWRVWEDDQHIAFLTPFGNTRGFTVVVPRQHLGSDIFGLTGEDYEGLVGAAYKVGQNLKEGLGVGKVGMFFEGFEVDYAHVKLVPIYETPLGHDPDPDPGTGTAEFQAVYAGYLTSQPGPLVQDFAALEEIAITLREMCSQE